MLVGTGRKDDGVVHDFCRQAARNVVGEVGTVRSVRLVGLGAALIGVAGDDGSMKPLEIELLLDELGRRGSPARAH